jgi:diguanylate cyclase (GGDEF)-like protein
MARSHMRALRRRFSLVWGHCRPCVRLLGRLRSLFPLGISARLGGALIAVAVLAATANVIISKGALLIRTTALSSDVSPQVKPLDPPLAASAPALAAPPPAVNHLAEDALLAALDRFESTGRRRAETQSPQASADYLTADERLRHELSSFVAAAPLDANRVASKKSLKPSLAQALDDLKVAARQLVQAGDRSRELQREYSEHLNAMDQRVGVSLDHAWHVFGRVIARQSLLKLRSDVDLLRQTAAQLPYGENQLASRDLSLAAGERTVHDDLASQQSAFANPLGIRWLADMRSDLDSLNSIRAEIHSLEGAYLAAGVTLAKNHASLSTQITSRSAPDPAAPKTASSPQMPAQTFAAHPATSRQPPDGQSPPVQSVSMMSPVPPHPAMGQQILSQPDSRARTLMSAVTAIVMFILVTICIFTVRSVLIPVRHILRATRALADGDPKSRASPTGIRELATLAGAFNEMAERLEIAQRAGRQQQDNLETQVLERTHKLQQLAEKDPLTSLSNRRHLFGKLNAAIERAKEHGRCIGVYFLDVDNFKNYNDSLGHVFGDRVLMSAANRLEEITEGIGFVARFGGDEFTVVYENAEGLDAIREFGSKLVDAFHQLLPVDERELSLSVSVGASVYPLHASDADGLLRAADSALFRAKELGRSQLAVFTAALTETAAARFSTEQGLRRALEHGEFELLYQPEVDLATFELGLVEALLRWRMPDGRLARPGEFLSVAEQSGLIVDINDWVLRTAVQTAAQWHWGSWPDARVAVNVTPRQLLDERFTERVMSLLEEFNLPARCIELELTESVLQTGPATITTLRKLQANGVAIALDDFGTGYSSLTSLDQLPLSRIKLDRSLICNIDTSARSAAIATAILDLCAGLNLQVTVEGIERLEQFAWLLGPRQVFLQGYLISVPVHGAEIVPLKQTLAAKMQDLLLTARRANDAAHDTIFPDYQRDEIRSQQQR